MQLKWRNSKVSFAFLLESLSTGFCFVRLALTGKLIKTCPPFYIVWPILSQYLEGFNNMIAKIEKKKQIFFSKYYDFLYNFVVCFYLFSRCIRDIRWWIKKTHIFTFFLLGFLFTFFESMQKAFCFMVVLSHHYSYYYFLFLVFCFYYYFVYIIIYFVCLFLSLIISLFI